MGPPIIGISMKSLEAVDGFTGSEAPSSVLGSRYIQAVAGAGGIPWPIPVVPEDPCLLRSILEHLDGLMLPGGSDIDPAVYGKVRQPTTAEADPSRDDTELTLLGWALAEGMPVLGICRGMQMLNLARGGTLVQDLSEEVPGTMKHDYFPAQGYARDLLVHEIRTVPGSAMRALLGGGGVAVNSLHHQGVADLGHGLVATALAVDGVVEGIEDPHQPFLMGVQWHPEELQSEPGMRRLLDAFINAAAAHAGRVGHHPFEAVAAAS